MGQGEFSNIGTGGNIPYRLQINNPKQAVQQ